MGRAPCCDKANVKRGPWSPEEDAALKNYLEIHGNGGNWIALPRKAGLKRCGKSCRLRWLNYLRPNIKHGGFTEEEDDIILTLFNKLGSRWSVIASHLPGRTDNDVKNHWNTKLKKRISMFSTNTSACGFMASHGTDQSMFLAQCSANLIQKTNSTIEVDDAANRSHPWGVLLEMADLDYGFMANSGPFLPAFSHNPTLFLSETMSSRDSCNGASAWDGDGDVAADGVNLSYQDQGYTEDDGGGLSSDFEVGFRFPHEVIHALCIPNSSTDFSPRRFLC